jgi:serine/threonine protein kinase
MQAAATDATRSANPAASRPGGRYVLGEQLGSGGMGAVHRARDSATGREVAFKQLHASLLGERRGKFEALFEREYHTLVRLKHPRIIEVYEYGLAEDGPYYTMELLEGQDLHQLAPLPYREVCRHLRDVASSLALMHAHRLVHRDVSPRNVRLSRDGRAKLIDFGALGTFGSGGDVIGTPMCMAPEVVRRMPIDQRTDLFALGAVGYWALTGQHAYPARRVRDLIQVWKRPPRAPSELAPAAGIPRALDALILALLQLDPLSRPVSGAAVIDQLTAIGELEPEEHEQAAESYLLSGRMVGRDDELAWGRKRIARALTGRGAEIVIEGPRGVGKTRLLHELSLEAQLRGMVALKADAQSATGAFGVAAALGAQLASALPEQAQ